jgi:iron(III) transport system ATP-binding protein
MSASLLRCESLTKTFDQIPAVQAATLAVHPGEILAIIGPSGCGKTTLLRLIAGFERPDEGLIWLGARLLDGPQGYVPPEQRSIGMVFQDLALFPHLTVAENIAFGLRGRARDNLERVAELLALVGLPGYAQRYPHELSGGERQRVALARAVAPRPQVLLLDEPFASLDADRRQRLRQEMRAVLKQTRTTAVIVTHDQEEAFYMGDRLAVMLAGQIWQTGRPEAVFSMPATRPVAAFLGGTDFLPASAVPGGFETELGYLPQAHNLAPGLAGELAVRPDDVSLARQGRENARIVERVYRGVNVQYRLELDSGQQISSLQAHTRLLEIGSRVCVQLEPGHRLAVYANGQLADPAEASESPSREDLEAAKATAPSG